MAVPHSSLTVFGSGGHAKVVIDAAEKQGIQQIIVADDATAHWGAQVMGYCIAGGRDIIDKSLPIIAAVGKNTDRMRIAAWLEAHGFTLATVIHPSSQIGRGAQIGRGSFLAAGTVINSDTVIGTHVIINTGGTVDHDCVISNGAHIGPGAHLCGQVAVGQGSLLGAGSIILPQVRIGSNCVVGAGSVVLNHIPDGVTVAGVPARSLCCAMTDNE